MTFQTQFPQLLQRIKADSPLIHCITNHISIHDCANALLALGGISHHGRAPWGGCRNHRHVPSPYGKSGEISQTAGWRP